MSPIDNKKPLIILTGPTAVGKTDLSLRLAKAIGGSIVSADSMQVYRRMDIGSAKIMPEEMQGIPHYLIDVLDPMDEFDVVKFQTMAKEALADIYAQGRIPIVTGGTGFYIQALLYDIDFSDGDADEDFRTTLEKEAEADAGALYKRLQEVDPKSAEIIHPNNIKRIIRALEYYEQTGEPISVHNAREAAKPSAYQSRYFVLNMERSRLYERIDRRVDIMMEQGLLDEVQRLMEEGLTRDMVSMQGLGYKEILDHLNGDISLEEAVYRIKRDTRHFAKRQITWFKRERDVIWVDKDSFSSEEDILAFMLEKIQGLV